jgi:hypothetical protein
MSDPTTIVVGLHWHEDQSEVAFITRSLAGALSRVSDVAVLAPGPVGSRQPDGAFDVVGMGQEGRYDVAAATLPRDSGAIVDDVSPEVVGLLSQLMPASVWYLSSTVELTPTWRQLRLVGEQAFPAGTYVRVNRAAEEHRHHGFGFTDYVLVLSDGVDHRAMPPAAVAWLSAADPRRDVVVVDAGVASAWRGRALRGSASVDTRMDLWRLLAHAGVCIDLAPGRYLARECVEALRFGTPIIVPADSGPAAVHARASGGSTFANPRELIDAVAALRSDEARAAASTTSRLYADGHYANPDALVASVRSVVPSP